MKPVDFKESTLVLKASENYQEIPAKEDRGGAKMYEYVTCWEFSDEEIEQLKKTKRLFITQITGLQKFNPMLLALEEQQTLKS